MTTTCECGAVGADDECQYPCNAPTEGATVTPADTLAKAAIDYRVAQENLDARREQLAQAVRDAVAEGMSQSEAARIVGVDRLTIRKWIGA